MTTLFPKTVTCSHCGEASEQTTIGSTNRVGTPDLDLRPPPMERNTIDHWLQDCPRCGYVASDISAVEEGLDGVLAGEDYRELAMVAGPGRARVVSAFRRRSLIDMARGNHAAAGSAFLCAAWVADDGRDTATALACRRAAAAHLQIWLDSAERSIERRLQLVDVLRRAGDFPAATRQAAIVTAAIDETSPLTPIIAYQKRLIAAQDVTCHTIEEAHEGK